MIICSCNVISDKDVKACAANCATCPRNARDVYRHLGTKPKCGRCVQRVQSVLEEALSAGRTAINLSSEAMSSQPLAFAQI